MDFVDAIEFHQRGSDLVLVEVRQPQFVVGRHDLFAPRKDAILLDDSDAAVEILVLDGAFVVALHVGSELFQVRIAVVAACWRVRSLERVLQGAQYEGTADDLRTKDGGLDKVAQRLACLIPRQGARIVIGRAVARSLEVPHELRREEQHPAELQLELERACHNERDSHFVEGLRNLESSAIQRDRQRICQGHVERDVGRDAGPRQGREHVGKDSPGEAMQGARRLEIINVRAAEGHDRPLGKLVTVATRRIELRAELASVF